MKMEKATAPTWHRPPVRVPSSVYGRSHSYGQRSRTPRGWHGRVPQDGVTATAAPAVDAVDAVDVDVDVDDVDTEVGDEKSDSSAVSSAPATAEDDDGDVEKSDCVVSLPPDQVCMCMCGRFPDFVQYR